MKLPHIPTPDEIIDKAFNRASKAASKVRSSKLHPRVKGKRIEEVRVDTACDIITSTFNGIVVGTPIIEELPEFYQDYIDIVVGVDQYKHSLGAVFWALGVIKQIQSQYTSRIRKSDSLSAIPIRKEAYGRIVSIVKRIEDELDFLDFCKRELKNMPNINFDAIRVVIAGFPNVGKSTLLNNITDASPKVANYPFTTQGLQIGNYELGYKKYQIIDTPGLLDRSINDMNEIELNAIAALEHLGNIIIYIFDPSETSGFLMENQYLLYAEIKKVFETQMICLFNKTDLLEDDSVIEEYSQKIDDPIFKTSINDLSNISDIKNLIEELGESFTPEDKYTEQYALRHPRK
ncbi:MULTISPECIES: NOG1 family protein [Methanosphaera]|jgi:nucleolar GTP-binding protein|uniref:Predicted GTPase n=4 Tax=Methanosphaera stadtmanae TaxID=2317 RepID=Q2NH98_METST|nr:MULTISPECIES: GTPase [Methanosphaera]ABC56805.1 predicted GTPase [Methanosphaera stadtmanae DSM 3091]MDO5822216.1 50S ribosome-binding GTPase [Methanosphaera sp.]OEC93364.1 GTP-binding protein [Methanosphaera sp. A6]RAP03489.1 GTP-binding protein [Methanosphaera stadtmanae]RAP48214.1 MAG: GTP-binding protein [Methanosphaera sp. DEW79]